MSSVYTEPITYCGSRIADLQHRKMFCKLTDKMSGIRHIRLHSLLNFLYLVY